MIATANAEMIMIAQKDPELKEILNTCDLVVPDGAGVLWAGEKLGTPFPERVAGADLAEELLKIASEKEWPVYFLGGAPGIAQRAAARFMELHVPFKLAGCHEGYFDSEEEKKILFSVADTGIGIPADKQEAVFERFTKLDTFVPGTGLGLSISRMIAEKMGGTLVVDSTYTTGCRFVLTLPLKE